jgi:hypothetical protein
MSGWGQSRLVLRCWGQMFVSMDGKSRVECEVDVGASNVVGRMPRRRPLGCSCPPAVGAKCGLRCGVLVAPPC